MKNLNIDFLSILIGLVVLISCEQPPQILEGRAGSDKYRLVWNDDPTSTMTIAWDQLTDGNPTVLYSKEDFGREHWKYQNKQTAQETKDNYEMNSHFAKLSGLDPDTRYNFVIQDSSGVSERYWFKTAPDTPKAFTFITGGDTKSEGKALEAGRASNRLVAKLRPLFIFFNGDFNSGDGLVAERWHQWLTDWQEMTTTEDGRMTPLVPVHGNHENGDHANLNYIFNAPYQENDSSRIYYSLSFGGDFFHLLTLNSEIDEGGMQRDWLENNLKEHKDYTFKVAGYHKPFWPHTSRKGENEYQFRQWAYLFYQYGLDISVDGDSHMHKVTFPLKPDTLNTDAHMGFVRDYDAGTMFLGEGSWGASPRKSDDMKPWSIVSGTFNQIKWVHVLPKTDNEPAQIKLYTAITATYDEDGNQTLYDAEVEALTEENLFDIPKGLNLFDTEGFGTVIKYPFGLNNYKE